MNAAKIEEGGLRALTTMVLKDDEKKSLTYDYLDGFEIIDDTFRLFLIEGISTGAMKK